MAGLYCRTDETGCTLINDSYNSDINSLDIALDFMNRRPDHRGRRHTLILSDIYQSMGCNLGEAVTVSPIAFPRCCRVLRDCHVASLLAMTRQGGAAMHQRPDAVELPCTRRSVSAATDAIGAHHFNDSLYELHCLPEIATSAYGLLAMTSRGLSPF